MKQLSYGTPMRILDGEKVYYFDDMVEEVRDAVRDYVGIHNPFDDECCATFEQYWEWANTL